MLFQRKSRHEVELLAFEELRADKDRKLLSNTNVDCYVRGFFKAQNMISTPVFAKETLRRVYDMLNERYEDIKKTAGYSGRFFTKEENEEMELINKAHKAIKELLR